MNILKFATKTLILAGVITTLAAAPSFAKFADCVGEGNKYPNLSTVQDDDHSVRCAQYIDEGGDYVTFYGKTSSDCAQASNVADDTEACFASAGADDEEDGEATASENDEELPDSEDESAEDEINNPQEETAADTAGPSENTAKKDEGLPIAAIIGIIVGVVAVIAIIVILIVMSKKKGGKNTPQAPDAGQTPQANPFATPGQN